MKTIFKVTETLFNEAVPIINIPPNTVEIKPKYSIFDIMYLI